MSVAATIGRPTFFLGRVDESSEEDDWLLVGDGPVNAGLLDPVPLSGKSIGAQQLPPRPANRRPQGRVPEPEVVLLPGPLLAPAPPIGAGENRAAVSAYAALCAPSFDLEAQDQARPRGIWPTLRPGRGHAASVVDERREGSRSWLGRTGLLSMGRSEGGVVVRWLQRPECRVAACYVGIYVFLGLVAALAPRTTPAAAPEPSADAAGQWGLDLPGC